MQQATINQTIRAIEQVLSDQLDQEVEETRAKRLSKEISKFGGVFDDYVVKNGMRD